MHLFITIPSLTRISFQDLSVFLSGILPRFDSILIPGVFYIHVCCYQKCLVKDFPYLIDSCNVVQSVRDPTHDHRHTLDLVLSCGLQLRDIDICKLNFSGQMPVIIQISAPCPRVKPLLPACKFCIIPPATAGCFSAVYQNIGALPLDNSSLKLSADHLLTLFSMFLMLFLLLNLSTLDLKQIPG